jgi:hypothetical protein
MGAREDCNVVRLVTSSRRSMAILLSLTVTVFAALYFFFHTNGFYGTNAVSLWEALHPQTLAQSDDVYLCTSLNGMGSDDNVNVLTLVFLFPLLLVRTVWLRREPGYVEVAVFIALSLPFLFLQYSVSYCGDIALTLAVGKNLALAGCLTGWVVTLILYLLRWD